MSKTVFSSKSIHLLGAQAKQGNSEQWVHLQGDSPGGGGISSSVRVEEGVRGSFLELSYSTSEESSR